MSLLLGNRSGPNFLSDRANSPWSGLEKNSGTQWPIRHIQCSRKAVGGEMTESGTLRDVPSPQFKTELHSLRGLLSRDETSKKPLTLMLPRMHSDLSSPLISAPLWHATLLPTALAPTYAFWKPPFFLWTTPKRYSAASLMNSFLIFLSPWITLFHF